MRQYKQYKKLPTILTALAFCALAVLAVSLLMRPAISTDAQEQKPVEVANDASFAEAERAGFREQTPVIPIQEILNTPEGSSCGWVADTVYPAGILDQATTVVGSNLYVFAGVSTAIIADARKYDGNTWTSIAPVPVALEFPAAVSSGTAAYIVNGVNASGTSVNTLYRYNPATNDYTTLAPSTTATWNHATAYLNGKIYKIGGYTASAGTSTATNAVEIYDVATNTWTTGPVYPLTQGWMSAFVRGNFIYVAGGLGSATGSVPSAKTYRYDPATGTWDDASIADLPVPRWGAASSQVGYGVGGGWVLAGGYTNGTAATDLSATVTRWDPTTNTWSALPSMLQARARMTGAVLGGSFYAIGGRSSAGGFAGTNDNQKLTCISGVAVINGGTVNITGESCGTPNGNPDPGETLTVTLPLTNTGDTATTNLSATLQATGGVVGAVTQSYGVLAPGGAAVSRNFTFTVASTVPCGGTVTLTFALTDGATSYGNITRTYTTGVRTAVLNQNFDGVTAPALPTGWTSVQTSGTAISWTTTTTTPSSAPNAAFANDPATVNAAALVSPAVAITSADSQITFKNKYILENNFDGMVLEYTTNGGTTWTDVITGGGSFVSGGYNGTISTAFMSPIAGRMAWTGTSADYVDTVVNLPASLNGQSVQFRWLVGSDNAVAATGAWVDDVKVLGARVCQMCMATSACAIQRKSDFTGDGITDYGIFRPSSGVWYVQPNGAGSAFGVAFGQAGDKLQPADYDGDGKADIGIYRSGAWYWIRSSDNTVRYAAWGAAGDIPVAGDYVGTAQAELAVYRPSSGVWYALNLADNTMTAVQWGGAASDVPIPGDFDNDCKLDFAVRRTTNDPSAGATQFYIRLSAGGVASVRWGRDDMALAIADYDGDGRSDVGVVDNNGGLLRWYVIKTNGAVLFSGTQFGQSGDIVTVGNYDADNKADLSIWRPSIGTFAYRSTVSGIEQQRVFGAASDIPTARAAQYPPLP